MAEILRPMMLLLCLAGGVAPALNLGGCEQLHTGPAPVTADAKLAEVKISGKTFKLEVAADDSVRIKGLGGRKEIAPDGGMIFAFPQSMVRVLEFVMRDCPIDIDIIYLDGAGRVLAFHEMKAEKPREADGSEGKDGDFDNSKYENRLKRYSSKYPATFAIELKPGSIKQLGVKEGDQVVFDHQGLKQRAK